MPPLSATKRQKSYKAGSIYSISLKNFMTYTNTTEIYPGRKFNVILGPNGSGKSAIVTAITIGLGGDLSLLRRQKHLKDLVNNNAKADERATITIKLHKGEREKDGTHRVDEIVCNINRSGGLEYLKNGRRVDKKEIVRFVEQYQIQTSNLCQFLPQDVVREFPDMKADQIFHNTLRAVGKKELLAMHDGLKSKQEEKRKREEVLATKKSTFAALDEKLEQKKELRRVVEKRRDCEEFIDLLKNQVLRLEIVDLLKRMKQSKKKIEEVKATKEGIKAERDQWQSKKSDVDKQKKVFEEDNRKCTQKIDDITRAIKSSKVAELESQIDAKTKTIHDNQQNLMSSKQRISLLKRQIEEQTEQLKSINPESLNERYEKCRGNLIDVETNIRDISQGIVDKKNKLQIEQSKIDDIRKKLQELNTEDNKKLQVLSSRNSDAHKGVQWLRNNKHLFKNPNGIYEPIMMYLKLSDPDKYSVQLEHVIGRAELEAFVCEDKDDANKLMHMLRNQERLHRINVVHSCAGQSTSPMWPSSQVKGQFLSKVIRDCPPAVMNHLCTKKQLHRIPVFESDPGQLPPNYSKYFIKKMLVEINVSRYGGNQTSKSSKLDKFAVKYLKSNVGSQDDSELNILLTEYMSKYEEVKSQIERLEASDRAEKENLKAARVEMARFEDEKRKMAQWRREIEIKKRQIEDYKSGREVGHINLTLAKERQDLVRQLVASNQTELDLIQTSIELATKVEMNNLKRQQLEHRSREVLNKYQESVAQFERIEDEERLLIASFNDTTKEWSLKKSLVKWKSPSDAFWDFPAEMKQAVEDKCPKVLSAAKALLDSTESKLKCLPTVTQSQLKELDTLEENHKNQKTEIEDLSRTVRGLERELKTSESTLVNGIQTIMSTINERFTDLMDVMGFAGEVLLHKGNHDLDFKNYGLQIMVKFRDKDTLQPLSQSTQSGGEKSVTTALYIMALQEMTQVPFRCVDEINQGMDETNERRVWNLLVETANKHSAQFFYLAPKFPQQLEFGDGITICTCYNGDIDDRKALDVELAMANSLQSSKRKKTA